MLTRLVNPVRITDQTTAGPLEAGSEKNRPVGGGAPPAVLNTLLAVGEVPSVSQADAARDLGLSEGAVKVAVHRLRKRFRELVKAEIAQTVDDPAQVAEELRYLVEVLTRSEATYNPSTPL